MAHELEIDEAGNAKMFYAGETPWHGLGTQVDGLLTAAEALKAAGLDWTVEKVPAYDMLPDGTFVQVPDRYHTRRDIDNKILGQVKRDYVNHQNVEAFEFFDTLVDSGEAKYETAGSLFGGSRTWMTAKVGDTMTVCGEEHDLYLLVSNSHDGSRAFTAATTMIRAVCNNTVTMGLNGAKTKWTLRHRTSLEGKAEEARKALELAFKNASVFDKEVQKMMDIQVTKDQFEEIISASLPDQKRQKEKNVASLMGVFESEPTVIDTDANGTAWGAFNAVTFWLDHKREVRSLDARMLSLTEGFGAKFRNDVHEKLLATV